MTEPAKQPPRSCCQCTAAVIVNDDLRVRVDTHSTESFSKIPWIRQWMPPAPWSGRGRKVLIKIGVDSAGNVRSLIGRPACRRLLQTKTAVEDAQTGTRDFGCEIVRAD